MLRKIRLLVLLLFTLLAACSQAPAPEAEAPETLAPMFGSTQSDYFGQNGLARHSSGVYAVGQTFGNLYGSNKGGGDVFLSKYDTTGAVMWGRQFGTSSYESPSGVATDAFDNAYVVGTTAGSLAGQYGSQDIFVRKYTRAGNVAWTIQFGTSGNDYAYGVASDSSGNVYVVGYQGVRQFLRKFNLDGSRLWTYYPSTGSFSDVAVDFSGNVYAAGTIAGANGNSAMLIRKFSPNGGASWSRQVEYSGGAYGTAVAVSGNHVYLVGYYQEREPYNVTPGFTKFSPDGVQQWSRPYGSYGAQYVFDASADSNGDLYFTGYWYNGSRWLGYVNKHSSYYGQDRWQKFVDAPQGAFNFAVVARTASEIYTGGYTYGNVGAGNNGNADVYLRHLNGSDGATVWTR